MASNNSEPRDVYKIDYIDGSVYEWSLGGEAREVDSYTPTLYVTARDSDLEELLGHMEMHPSVNETGYARRRPNWGEKPRDTLYLSVADPEKVMDMVREIRRYGSPGQYRLYNVDITRGFRYCLDNSINPAPTREPSTLRIQVHRNQVIDEDLGSALIDEERCSGGAENVLGCIDDALNQVDPDVLVLSHSELVSLIHREADRNGFDDLYLGRMPGEQMLAGRSTHHSYGRTIHSPPRYNVAGRAIVDESNSFLWSKAGIQGIMDMVNRSHKPIQEVAWASIGNVFTSIQIRHAYREGVLVPWKSWRHEAFKSMHTLHSSDRGGVIFSPRVGMHTDVQEVDFEALYPNIIVTRNISPDTVLCRCHDNNAVPELGYSICEDEGYLPGVLRSMIKDRRVMKQDIQDASKEHSAALQGRCNAIKWILVSCFGYQGFSNAKYGRIECHEAINAYAREIMLTAKEICEDAGWRVVHGIIDSIWLKENGDAEDIHGVCRAVTDETGINLDYEGGYEWICFVPRRGSNTGALNRYFGKRRDGEYKTRGIECRQRSTPRYVSDSQMEFIDALDRTRDPGEVCECLSGKIDALRRGDVDPMGLRLRRRVSKPLHEYRRHSHSVSAAKRRRRLGYSVHPGEDVCFVVVDSSRQDAEAVRLGFEEIDGYDVDYYVDMLVRAAESVASPLGWREERIRRYLSNRVDASLSSYTG